MGLMHGYASPPQKDADGNSTEPPIGPTLKRFLPYLWPKNAPQLKLRILLAAVLVLASKAIQLSMAFVYGGGN